MDVIKERYEVIKRQMETALWPHNTPNKFSCKATASFVMQAMKIVPPCVRCHVEVRRDKDLPESEDCKDHAVVICQNIAPDSKGNCNPVEGTQWMFDYWSNDKGDPKKYTDSFPYLMPKSMKKNDPGVLEVGCGEVIPPWDNKNLNRALDDFMKEP